MKTRKFTITIVASAVLMLISQPDAGAWGQKGHDIVCEMAQRHLSPKAKKEIKRIFDGRSLVYWGNWMDTASNTPEYKYTKSWHYKDIDTAYTYETTPPAESGDVVSAINAQIEALKSGTLNKEAEALALKMLIHLVGDLHCPMHLGHLDDLGGNRRQVQFFGKGSNLHSICDSGIIERAHSWSYKEWVEQIDVCGKREIVEITSGGVDEWGKQTYQVANVIYARSPKGASLSYDYVSETAPAIEMQLRNGGVRLAKILNELFN